MFLLLPSLCLGEELDSTSPALEGSVDLAMSHNPVTLGLRMTAYRRFHYGKNQSMLWKDLYFQWGVQTVFNPSYIQYGTHIEWLPIALLKLRASYDAYHHFGQYGTVLSFDNANDAYSDSTLMVRQGSEQSGFAQRFALQPTVRLRLGKFVARHVVNINRYRFSQQGEVFLDRAIDILVAQDGHVLVNTSQLLFDFSMPQSRLLAGTFYELTKSVEADLRRQRLGGVVFFSASIFRRVVSKPRGFAQVAYNIEDRNRQGGMFFLIGGGFDYTLF